MAKRLMARMMGMFRSRTQVGVDRAGNNYFSLVEEVDGAMKEKRWVEFKGDQDPTTVPVEWICWLNGQRKKAPTPEELAELEARRERVRLNVELLKKKEEEERRAGVRPVKKIDQFFGYLHCPAMWCSSMCGLCARELFEQIRSTTSLSLSL